MTRYIVYCDLGKFLVNQYWMWFYFISTLQTTMSRPPQTLKCSRQNTWNLTKGNNIRSDFSEEPRPLTGFCQLRRVRASFWYMIGVFEAPRQYPEQFCGEVLRLVGDFEELKVTGKYVVRMDKRKSYRIKLLHAGECLKLGRLRTSSPTARRINSYASLDIVRGPWGLSRRWHSFYLCSQIIKKSKSCI